MNSAERHEARYQRRKAAREAKRRKRLDVYDNFDRVASIPALMRANFDSRKGVMWKASVARYNAHFLKFAVMQSRDLYAGKFKCSGFFVFWIVERGKRRHVHSLHYAERVIRRSFCINALVPILSSGLIYDNDNIDKLMFERFLGQKVRRAGRKGGKTFNPKKRTKEDDERFERNLLKILNKAS